MNDGVIRISVAIELKLRRVVFWHEITVLTGVSALPLSGVRLT